MLLSKLQWTTMVSNVRPSSIWRPLDHEVHPPSLQQETSSVSKNLCSSSNEVEIGHCNGVTLQY